MKIFVLLPTQIRFDAASRAVQSAFLAIWLACALSACERESSAGFIDMTKLDSANHYSEKPMIQVLDSGFTKARVTAGWIRMYDRLKRKRAGGGIRAEFYARPNGALASVMTADSAEIDDEAKLTTALGKVIVVSGGSGTTLTTTKLVWDENRNVLRSDAFVEIISPAERLQGYGFESDPNLKSYTVYKVTGQTVAPSSP
jgi:LPS export ABC transporter protein LptC